MRKLEEFITEKLRVTKSSRELDLLDLVKCKTIKEYESKCLQLIKYLKDKSDLPIAELEDFKNSLKRLSVKYKNTNDTFLWVLPWLVCYGTWGNAYFIQWDEKDNKVKNYNGSVDGFKEFRFIDKEMHETGGVFIITKNDDLMEQIDTLTKTSEPIA